MGLLDFWIIKCTRFRILLPFWGYHKVKNGSGITTCILLVENIDYQGFITRKLLLRIAKAQILSPSCWLQYRYYSPPSLLQAGHGRKLNMSQYSLEYNNFSCKAFFSCCFNYQDESHDSAAILQKCSLDHISFRTRSVHRQAVSTGNAIQINRVTVVKKYKMKSVTKRNSTNTRQLLESPNGIETL